MTKNLIWILFSIFINEKFINTVKSSTTQHDFYCYSYRRSCNISYQSPEDYVSYRWIGGGTYGSVYEAFNIETGDNVAIKRYKQNNKNTIYREIELLVRLQNCPYILEFKSVVRHLGNLETWLITGLANNVNFKEFIKNITEEELEIYMYKLIKGLKYAHDNGIMHRDIKPGNIAFDRTTKKLVILDWGFGDLYYDGSQYRSKVGTKVYAAPELLLNYTDYSYPVDMWSAGCVMGQLMYNKAPLFVGNYSTSVLDSISTLLGTDELYNFIKQHQGNVEQRLYDNFKEKEGKNLLLFNRKNREHLITKKSVDLLKKLLHINPNKRISPQEALNHPFFDNLRHINV